MWCRNCNIETNEDFCPVCGQKTEEDVPAEVMWCAHCSVPIIKDVNDQNKETCPLCGGKTSHLSADLRPVFPEERLLLELLLNKKPNELISRSVWASNNRYYVDCEKLHVAIAILEEKYPCRAAVLISPFGLVFLLSGTLHHARSARAARSISDSSPCHI